MGHSHACHLPPCSALLGPVCGNTLTEEPGQQDRISFRQKCQQPVLGLLSPWNQFSSYFPHYFTIKIREGDKKGLCSHFCHLLVTALKSFCLLLSHTHSDFYIPPTQIFIQALTLLCSTVSTSKSFLYFLHISPIP